MFFLFAITNLLCNVVLLTREPRYTAANCTQNVTAVDVDIIAGLRCLFAAFDVAEQYSDTGAQTNPEDCIATNRTAENENSLRCRRNVEVMRQCCGFAVERRPSTLEHGGSGVIVTSGTVPAGVVTSLYPGVVPLLS